MQTIRTMMPVVVMWMSTLMLSQSMQMPNQAQPIQDPHSRNLISIDPIDPIVPIECLACPPVEITVTPQTPIWAIYQFFFTHLANLDQVADEVQASGKIDEATAWRTHEQRAAGLTGSDGQTMKQVAYDCNTALQIQDAQIQAAIIAFHSQYQNEQIAGATLPANLTQLWDERIQIINAHIDQLRLGLGDVIFQKLDTYIKANFTPGDSDISSEPMPKSGGSL